MASEPFSNGLSDAQTERLALLAEECGEVVQMVGKVLRHGYASRHPDGGLRNMSALEKEIGHVLVALALLCASGDLDTAMISHHSEVMRAAGRLAM